MNILSGALIAVLLFTASLTAPAQEAKAKRPEEVGDLVVSRDRVVWSSPEALVRDLRSADDDVRLRALLLIGTNDQQAHRGVHSQGSPSKLIGTVVVTPDQIDLRYAALGSDASKQAIVTVQLDSILMAAVAIPKSKGWQRIAVFDCWCKYDMENALGEFVNLTAASSPTEPRFELVLRASGGGTGIYTQNEAHFRVYHGEVRLVLSFVSRLRSCDPTGPAPHWCAIEKRWFYRDSDVDGVLVKGTGRFKSDGSSPIDYKVRGLEGRYLQRITCRTYKWNEQTFRYERSAATAPCKPTQ